MHCINDNIKLYTKLTDLHTQIIVHEVYHHSTVVYLRFSYHRVEIVLYTLLVNVMLLK